VRQAITRTFQRIELLALIRESLPFKVTQQANIQFRRLPSQSGN
jgi:hypothetical protein